MAHGNTDELKIASIHFDEAHIEITLAGGKCFRHVLTRHGLHQLTPRQCTAWVLSEDQYEAVWPHKATINSFDLMWDDLCEIALTAIKSVHWELEALPLREQEIVALWRLEADGYNGGFIQFFCNWGVQTYQLALTALQNIGANATHAVVSGQYALIERLENHPEINTLWDIPEHLTEDEATALNTLDQALWKAAEQVPRLAVLHYFCKNGL